MKPARSLLIAFTLLFLSGTAAVGQVEEGLCELNISGGLTVRSQEGSSFTVFQLALTNGYFVSDRFEIGADFSITKAEGFDTFGDLSGFVAMHFPGSQYARVVPFIGARAGFGYGDDDDNPAILGASGGLKFFVAEGGGAYTLRAYYQRRIYEGGGINYYGIMNGISIFY